MGREALTQPNSFSEISDERELVLSGRKGVTPALSRENYVFKMIY